MPYVKKRRVYKKRPMRRYRRRANRKTRVSTTTIKQFSLPDRVLVKLPYIEYGNVTSALAFNDKTWNINSVFDPDLSGVGHQPRSFDTWAGIYGRYRVRRVDAMIRIRQRASHGICANLIANNSSSALGTYDQELVRSGLPKITSSNSPPIRINRTFYPNGVTGVTRSAYNIDDRFQAGVASNPAELIVLHQLVASLDQTTAIDYEYQIRLVYHCEFFDKANLPVS